MESRKTFRLRILKIVHREEYDKLMDCVKELEDEGCDFLRDVRIVLNVKKSPKYPAFADTDGITISWKLVQTTTSNELKGIILHELYHFKNIRTEIIRGMLIFLSSETILKWILRPLTKGFNHRMELNADKHAFDFNPLYAKSLIELFKRISTLDKRMDLPNFTHPRSSVRIAKLESLLESVGNG